MLILLTFPLVLPGAHKNIDNWLARLNPEVALIMFGTNDLGPVGLEEYKKKTREVVQKCLDNGTVVILSTIPPRHGLAEKAALYADAMRKIAGEMKMATYRKKGWEKITVYRQGYQVQRLVLGITCLWYHVCRDVPIRMVIVRDPSGKEKDDFFLLHRCDGGGGRNCAAVL